jgi:hypothetical protein
LTNPVWIHSFAHAVDDPCAVLMGHYAGEREWFTGKASTKLHVAGAQARHRNLDPHLARTWLGVGQVPNLHDIGSCALCFVKCGTHKNLLF